MIDFIHRRSSVLTGLLAALSIAAVGCTYNPNPKPGTLLCSASGSCPQGYACQKSCMNTCWPAGTSCGDAATIPDTNVEQTVREGGPEATPDASTDVVDARGAGGQGGNAGIGGTDGGLTGCSGSTHDDGTGKCVGTGCANGYHDGGAGICVVSGSCSSGYHDDGAGSCASMGCATGYHDGGDGTCVASGSCSAGHHDDGTGVCVTVGCAGSYHDGGGGACVANGSCSAGFHDDGTASCVASGCAMGYHDGGAGQCVTNGSCSSGYHGDGSGKCVSTGCAAGFHDGGDGTCVTGGTCSPGYHDDGSGKCVLASCATGYHDGGNGTCVLTASCSGGYHDGGGGICVPTGSCSGSYHDGGGGSCVPAGSCSVGYHDDGSGTCVATGCATGYHDGGGGACVLAGVCSGGYHSDGTGVCVAIGCASNFHDGGSGICVSIGTCSSGYHSDGTGVCLAAGCATGYHNGGDGTCVLTSTCSGGYHNDGTGVCVSSGCAGGYSDDGTGKCVTTGCATGYHSGGGGLCVPNGTCSTGYHDGGDGTCVTTGSCSDGYRADAGGVCNVLNLELVAGELGGPGNIDGTGVGARFNGASGIAIDSNNAFVADAGNHVIRRIALSSGAVNTIAGSPGIAGSTDGIGMGARFNSPSGVALYSGSLYVADKNNHTIRQLQLATGTVTTFAGAAGVSGSADGVGAAARFNGPQDLIADASHGYLYVADSENHTIRVITLPTGAVTTLAGTAGMTGTADGTGPAARFTFPTELAADGSGNLFVVDMGAVRKIVIASGIVSTLTTVGVSGVVYGVAYGNGVLYADQYGRIATVNQTNGSLSLFASIPCTLFSTVPRFDEGLYLLGTEIDAVDLTSTAFNPIAGTATYKLVSDQCDGPWLAAPSVVDTDGQGNVFIDDENQILDSVTLATGSIDHLSEDPCDGPISGITNSAVSSIFSCSYIDVVSGQESNLPVGSVGLAGASDGTGSAALFNNPQGVAVDGAGNVYVADAGNHTIRKVVIASGVVTTVAGKAGVAGSSDGVGASAMFNGPMAVAVDGRGNLFVADAGNQAIRQIVLSSRQVTTLAGTAGVSGTTDGMGSTARFIGPRSITPDTSGHLFVADGNTVRRITVSSAEVTTWVGVPGRVGVVLGALPGGLNQPGGVIVLPTGELVITDVTENSVLIVR